MSRLEGKVALVVGGSRNAGAAMADAHHSASAADELPTTYWIENTLLVASTTSTPLKFKDSIFERDHQLDAVERTQLKIRL